eukprot:gnl/TRDRNA2_/TRDRNA2_135339_c0_seq1.p1 gnl/TRDRNA2_/TRDRNA2_135339_c0~~gnl/TRDRNA2_/TRDRNA2_135339_c0_seq1.p1  ORF type:complete len:393 (+),score=60.16 gnl/TRDRNA2_/TRDRNA2_135339_c0_seq1:78-1256(+)
MVDSKDFMGVVKRLECMFALLSLMPVVSDIRFSHFRREMDRVREKAPAEKDAKKDEKATEKPEAKSSTPTSILSIFGVACLLASELLGIHELFRVPLDKSSKKATGMFPIFAQSIRKANARVKPSMALQEKALTLVNVALEPPEAFAATHGLCMTIALSCILGMQGWQWISKAGAMKALATLVYAAIFILFFVGQRETLGQVLSHFVNAKLLFPTRMALRSAAIISCGDTSGSNNSSSPGFAIFQTVSLVAAACTAVSNPNVVTAASALFRSPLETSMDNLALQQLGPLVLAVLWMFGTQLWTNMGSMITVLGLSSLVSPKMIAKAWPAMAGMLGSSALGSATALLQILTVCYVVMALLVIFCGGTIAIVSGMFLLQVLAAIHGLEAFGMTT